MDNGNFRMSRNPLKPLAYKDRKYVQPKELVIDYLPYEDDNGNIVEPSYNIYIANENRELVNITALIIAMLPTGIADNLDITIEGNEDTSKLREVINYIYSNFIFADPEYEDSIDIWRRINSPTSPIRSSLLRDQDGHTVLPITTAQNVYISDGTTVEEKLKSITRIGFSARYVVANQTGDTFEFEYPFRNYPNNGNYVEVRIGGAIVNPARYYITDSPRVHEDPDDPNSPMYTPVEATIHFRNELIEEGRTISFLFMYNTSNGSMVDLVSGTNIAPGSVHITSMYKYSDSYLVNDPMSFATSQALFNLYTTLSNAINNQYNTVWYGTGQISNDRKNINIPAGSGFTLIEGSMINVIIPQTTAVTGCTVTINNGSTNYDIYNGANKLLRSIPAGQMITLYYSTTDNRFYIKPKLSCNRWAAQLTIDNQPTISFNGLYFELDSEIFVYRNGVRLFEGLDYTIDRETKTIATHVPTEKDERFVFETYSIFGEG